MKITSTRDDVAGTVQIVLDMTAATDTDQAADAAFHAVLREMAAAKRHRGTTPEGLRTPLTE